MLFDIFNKRHDGHLTREEIKDVIKLIFKDFNMPYEVNDLDVQNFLQDFDINHDHEITIEDFKGVDVLHFDLHQENEMRVYWSTKKWFLWTFLVFYYLETVSIHIFTFYKVLGLGLSLIINSQSY